jgi:pimeloyl-ACP methyl ester carboxylesterase
MRPSVLGTDIQGEGEPVVLVPGGLTGWLSWIPHQERLSPEYRVVRVQPMHNERGSRGEPGDPSYSAEIEREALRLTLDDLELEQAHFAGWSGGGRALVEFALAYPSRLLSLTLVEPAAYWVLRRLGECRVEVEDSESFLEGLTGKEVTEEDLMRFLRAAGFVTAGGDPRQDANWERWSAHRMALSWQTAALTDAGRSVDEVGRLEVPTLLVRGTRSSPVDRRVVGVLAERLPRARLLELEGDHASHIQQIDEFLEAFRAHLGGR